MFEKRQLDQAFQDAAVLPLSASSRYTLFSDCHRGNGLTGDNFLKNQHLYAAALRYYYENDFTYIELGDGDELWENRSFTAIKEAHATTFQMLARFYADQRLYLMYGNHDMSKRSAAFSSQCDTFHPCITCREEPLFPDIRFHPGLILRNQETGPDLYLTHGHQADFLNSVLWRQARFLVRCLWRFSGSFCPRQKKQEKGTDRKNSFRLGKGKPMHPGCRSHPPAGTGSFLLLL